MKKHTKATAKKQQERYTTHMRTLDIVCTCLTFVFLACSLTHNILRKNAVSGLMIVFNIILCATVYYCLVPWKHTISKAAKECEKCEKCVNLKPEIRGFCVLVINDYVRMGHTEIGGYATRLEISGGVFIVLLIGFYILAGLIDPIIGNLIFCVFTLVLTFYVYLSALAYCTLDYAKYKSIAD